MLFKNFNLFQKNKVLPTLPCIACVMLKCVGADAEKRMSRRLFMNFQKTEK